MHYTHTPHGDIQTTYHTQDPAAVAEIALAVQLERLRVTEALAARDNVVVRLEDAYTSVRQKSATISRLERELDVLRRSSTPSFSNTSALQESQCCDSSTAVEGATDVNKSINLERHVREMHPTTSSYLHVGGALLSMIDYVHLLGTFGFAVLLGTNRNTTQNYLLSGASRRVYLAIIGHVFSDCK